MQWLRSTNEVGSRAPLLHHPQDILGFQGYRASLPRRLLFVVLCVLTFGVLFVISRWFLRLRIALTLVRCPLAQAEWVVVTVSRRLPSAVT